MKTETHRNVRLAAVYNDGTGVILGAELNYLLWIPSETLWIHADTVDGRVRVTGPVYLLEKLVECKTFGGANICQINKETGSAFKMSACRRTRLRQFRIANEIQCIYYGAV